MEEGRCSVLIVGAGLAGLACAKYLMDHDFDDVLVIEAQDRVGGRCQTIEFGKLKARKRKRNVFLCCFSEQ